MPNPFRYTGRGFDAEAGLYFYRTRYYDPSIGRFIAEDPIRFDAGTNFYTYAQNNPAKFIDPKGLFPQLQGGGAGWEAHFIYGYGRDTFYCCDGCNIWRIRTSKHCLGGGFFVSGGITAQCTGSSGKKTCPDGYEGFAAEFGIGPGEYGLGIGKSGLTNTLGLGGGTGGKATICYYIVLDKTKVGKCSF